MSQTGTGALSINDVEVLRTGYLLVFPTPRGSGGGPVLLLDSTRLQHALASVLDRCVFYLLTVCSDEGAQTQGGTLLNIVSSRKGPMKSMKQKQQQWEFVHKAMPFKFKRCVVVQSFEEGKEILLEFLAFQQSRLLEYTSGIPTDLISKASFASTLRELLKEGFDCSHIPTSLGGDYDYGRVTTWTRMRLSIEDAMGSAPPKRNAIPQQLVATSMKQPARGMTRDVCDALRIRSVAKRSHFLMNENQHEIVRQRNASYARRSYHRKKLEVVVQQEELAALDRASAKLRAENVRLQQLLAQAQRIVALAHHPQAHGAAHHHQTLAAMPAPLGGFFVTGDFSSYTLPNSISRPIMENDSSHNSSTTCSIDTGSTGSVFSKPGRGGIRGETYSRDLEWHEQSRLRRLFMR